jgi:amino acid transporter
MTRNQKFALFLALALIGGIGIGLSTFLAIGRIRDTAPDTAHIIIGTLVVTLAMVWACFFTVRAHYAQDEFRRQREISAGYWGGWLGIAASAPIFFFIAIGGFGVHPAAHVHPSIIFTAGYVLAPICGAVGAVGARVWLHYRDR